MRKHSAYIHDLANEPQKAIARIDADLAAGHVATDFLLDKRLRYLEQSKDPKEVTLELAQYLYHGPK